MTTRNCPTCREETAHFNGTCAKCGGKKPLEYCCECNISFGSAEPRYAVARKGVAHKDCYEKWLLQSAPTGPPRGKLRTAYYVH